MTKLAKLKKLGKLKAKWLKARKLKARKLKAWLKIIGGAIYLIISGKVKLRDLTKNNIKGYIQGHLREYKAEGLEQHIKEQIIWRFSIMNEICLKNRKCPCECEVPGKQYEDRECEEACYPMLLDAYQWEQIREVYGIDDVAMERIKDKTRKRLEEYGYHLEFDIDKV